MKSKKFFLVLVLVCLFTVSSCSSFEITPDIQKSIDKYISAVMTFESFDKGDVKITTVQEDNSIDFKTTKSVIDYSFTIVDEKVVFERKDYLDDVENAHYKSDGEKVMSFDYENEEWVDKTKENASFLSAKTNPITSLSLFRVDNNYKIRSKNFSDISESQQGEYTVIKYVLDDGAVSSVLGLNKVDGIVRESAGHTRSYYIDAEGNLKKIVIEALQNVVNNGEKGNYKSIITVEIS